MKVALPISILMLFLSTACTKQTEGIKPQYRNVTEAVYSTVLVEPRNSYKVYPPVSGIIDELIIEEGDEVKKNDILVKIRDTKSDVNIENAQLNYEIAKETFKGDATVLKDLEEEISSAREKVLNDSINYERQKRLWQQNVGSRQEYENRKLAYDLSLNQLKSVINSYNRTKSELQRQMEIAGNSIKINKLNRDDFTVRSKLDGLVYSVLKEEGESVTNQTIIAIIGSKSDFILSLLIDEVDIRKVYKGQKVIVTLEAYPDSTFEARISRIYPEKDERSQTFAVEAEFVTKPQRLLKGLSGEANIIINSRDNVLTIPSQYINEDKKVNTEDGLIQVEIGLQSLEFAEILSGIDSSTVIKKIE